MPNSKSTPLWVFPEPLDEAMLDYAPIRGYLSDVKVELSDGHQYRVFFASIGRIKTELEIGVKMSEPYFIEHGLILLPEVTLERIEAALTYLSGTGFFKDLKPVGS